MPSVSINRNQAAYLDRTARRLSSLSGRRVSKSEVLAALLDLAIDDEGIYDPETSEPIDPLRKQVCQAEKEARTASFDVAALLSAVTLRS